MWTGADISAVYHAFDGTRGPERMPSTIQRMAWRCVDDAQALTASLDSYDNASHRCGSARCNDRCCTCPQAPDTAAGTAGHGLCELTEAGQCQPLHAGSLESNYRVVYKTGARGEARKYLRLSAHTTTLSAMWAWET